MQDGNVDGDRLARLEKVLQKPVWDEWLFKDTGRRAKLLQLNLMFQEQVLAIRHRFDIDPKLYQTKAAAKGWIKALEPRQQEWDEYVNYIMVHANLMSGWRRAINGYILTDKFNAPPGVLIHDTPDRHGHPVLQLTINDQVSKTDFDKLIPHINDWVAGNGHKTKAKRMPYKRIDYYFEMYELKQDGIDNAQIAAKLSKKYEANERAPSFTTRYVREKLGELEQLIDSQFS